jgi:hypothetical protein
VALDSVRTYWLALVRAEFLHAELASPGDPHEKRRPQTVQERRFCVFLEDEPQAGQPPLKAVARLDFVQPRSTTPQRLLISGVPGLFRDQNLRIIAFTSPCSSSKSSSAWAMMVPGRGSSSTVA